MTNEEIDSARRLIAAVGEPQGQYAEEVMKLFRQLLDGHESANLQLSDFHNVTRALLKALMHEHLPFRTIGLMSKLKGLLPPYAESRKEERLPYGHDFGPSDRTDHPSFRE